MRPTQRRSSFAPKAAYVAPPGHDPQVQCGPAFAALGDHMGRLRAEEGPRPTADGTLLRGSQAGACNRRVAFEALGTEMTNDLNTDTLVTFEIGKLYHERIQLALVERFGAATEVMCSYKEQGISMSGHADAVYHDGTRPVVVEIKSMKAFGFDLAVNGNRFDNHGPGPKKEHLMQAGIYALAPQIKADAIHMIYVNKDTGELAEWVIDLDEELIHFGTPTTTVRMMALNEITRLNDVAIDVTNGWLPERIVPGYGVVDHEPPTATSKNKPWMCRYCSWRDLCARLPYQAIELKEIPWDQLTNPTKSSSTL